VKPGPFESQKLLSYFKTIPWHQKGRVNRIHGQVIKAFYPGAKLGSIAEIEISSRDDKILAEVVGFDDDQSSLLIPYTHLEGCRPGCIVNPIKSYTHIAAGDFLLGKVVDPFLQSLGDEKLLVPSDVETVPLENAAPDPMKRQRVSQPLSLGVRAIDGLLTLGQGQRVGIMAGSGVGKSVLLGMMARNSQSDINVIGLIGERGREVREFIEKDLGPSGLKKSVIVAVTSDQSPLMKIRGAKVATAIAEHFSAKGKNVLLMIDSITRVAMAQREIGGAIGEPPTTKGYTPSVFALLPKLLERSGTQCQGSGTISGIYTVLVDGDDFNDPIADSVRSILDGHINLSRDLAASGHFPAIEVTTSASRVMNDIVSDDHLAIARKIKSLIATYKQNLDLIQIGAYQAGTNPNLDLAIHLMPMIERFLAQSIKESSDYTAAMRGMIEILQYAQHDREAETN
jgi:flagellum-specific ATP synthase